MHCTKAKVVPEVNVHQLQQANPDAQLILFEGCSHAELFWDHPQAYLDALIPFLQEKWS